MKYGAKDFKRRPVLHYEVELHEHAFDDVNDDDGDHSEVALRSSVGKWGSVKMCISSTLLSFGFHMHSCE